jgi:hypothetical protein
LVELGDVALAPGALEPYCLMQSSRSVPVMPTHCLGSGSPLVAPDTLLGLEP